MLCKLRQGGVRLSVGLWQGVMMNQESKCPSERIKHRQKKKQSEIRQKIIRMLY